MRACGQITYVDLCIVIHTPTQVYTKGIEQKWQWVPLLRCTPQNMLDWRWCYHIYFGTIIYFSTVHAILLSSCNIRTQGISHTHGRHSRITHKIHGRWYWVLNDYIWFSWELKWMPLWLDTSGGLFMDIPLQNCTTALSCSLRWHTYMCIIVMKMHTIIID